MVSNELDDEIVVDAYEESIIDNSNLDDPNNDVGDINTIEKEDHKKPKRWKYVLSILFLLALFVITIVILLYKYPINEIVKSFDGLDYKYIFISLSMIFVYIFFEGVAMKLVLRSMRFRVSLLNNITYSAIDYYFCAITPSATGGQPMVAYYMAKDKIPLAETSIVLLINTALFKIVLLVFSIVALICCPGYIFSRTIIIVLFILGFLLNVLLVFLCFLGAFSRRRIERAGKKIILLLKRFNLVRSAKLLFRTFIAKMDDFERGGRLMKNHKSLIALALLSNFLQRIALFSVGFFVYLAFIPVLKENNPDFVMVGFIELFAIQVIIAISVDSLPLPGGVGISEWLYIFLFEFIYGTEVVIASAMMVTRAISFYIPLIVTSVIFIIKHISVIVKSRRK